MKDLFILASESFTMDIDNPYRTIEKSIINIFSTLDKAKENLKAIENDIDREIYGDSLGYIYVANLSLVKLVSSNDLKGIYEIDRTYQWFSDDGKENRTRYYIVKKKLIE